ncbi:MAG: hypothetical protein K0Q63_1983 [Paenibacillus sp.]|nr:hypothetical protein [Paenibacillus sp.]
MDHFQPSAGFHNDTNTALQVIRSYVAAEDADLLTEELLLGIGGGIGYGYFTFYYEQEDFTNFHLGTRAIWEDSAAFIGGIFSSLELTLEIKQTKERRAAFEKLAGHIEKGIPVMLPVHHGLFEGEGMTESGFQTYCAVYELDKQRGVARLAHRFAGGVEVTLEDLINGRSNMSTQKLRNQSLHVKGLEAGPNYRVSPEMIAQASRQGIERCIASANNPRMNNFGISALDKWAERIKSKDKQSWMALFGRQRHWTKTLHSTVQHIVRNTDGCAFRLAYASFLRRMGEQIGEEALHEAAARFEASGALWRSLAEHALPDEVAGAAALRVHMTETERLARSGELDFPAYVRRLKESRGLKEAFQQSEEWPIERKREHAEGMIPLLAGIKEHESSALLLLERSLQSKRWG